MTIKSALSVIALAAGLTAGPAFAQTAAYPTMIGTQTVSEADAGAVEARCLDLQTAEETESLISESDSEADTDDASDGSDDSDDNETAVAGDADIANEPALTDSPTALGVDLALVTLADCEADGWLSEM